MRLESSYQLVLTPPFPFPHLNGHQTSFHQHQGRTSMRRSWNWAVPWFASTVCEGGYETASKSEVRGVLRGCALGSLLVSVSNAGAVAEICAVHVQRDRNRVTDTTRAGGARRHRGRCPVSHWARRRIRRGRRTCRERLRTRRLLSGLWSGSDLPASTGRLIPRSNRASRRLRKPAGR
jgi:hypothetical protein